MSDMSEKARSAAKAKVERLTRAGPMGKIDASDFSAQDAGDANGPTGMRPISRTAYKRGGKVHGDAAKMHAGRKPRKSGGPLTADGFINRDVKEANEKRPGINYVGGMKRGGKVHGADCDCAKCSGGRVGKKAGGVALDGGTRPTGGRLARKGGGRAKKGMNVNIIIAPSQPKPMMPPPGALAAPGGGPVGLHQGAPPPMMPPGAAPPMGPPMGRKSGGRAYPIESGAGGGLGRLEKARAYGP